MIIESNIAMTLDEFIALRCLQVFAHHLGNKLFETDLGCPAQLGLRLARITQQGFHLCWAEMARVNRDDTLAGVVVALFRDTLALPVDRYVQLPGRRVDKIAYTVLHTRGDNEILGLLLLQH